MESQYFTFTSFDQQDVLCLSFYQCVITTAFGPYSVGDVLDCVCIDYGKGVIEVWKGHDQAPIWSGKLTLNILDVE